MKIFIGADHRGFELKNQLVEWLKSEGHDVEDCGNTVHDSEDDYPEIAKKLIESMQMGDPTGGRPDGAESPQGVSTGGTREEQAPSESFGILLCGSGIGVSIVANRYKGIRCALGFDPEQVAHGRTNDHINVLSIPSDFVDFEKAKELVKAFLETQPKMEEKYVERVKELDE